MSPYWQRVQAGSQIGLFFVALATVAYLAKDILLPLVVATLFFFLLRPVVRQLTRAKLPLALASLLTVSAVMGALGFASYKLSGPAIEWSEGAVGTLRRIGRELSVLKKPVASVSRAADEAEKIAGIQGQAQDQQVVVGEPGLGETLWAAMQSFVFGILLAVSFLLLLLMYGERWLATLLSLLLPRIGSRVENDILAAIEWRISLYLGTFCLENLGLAVLATLLFWSLGMPNPALWGALGGVLNFVPYLGAITTTCFVAVVGYDSFNDVWQAIAIAGCYLALTTIEGMLIQPAVFGKRLSLNPLMILLAVVLGMWLFGIVGAFVAVPCLVAIKAVSDQVSPLQPLANLLGELEEPVKQPAAAIASKNPSTS